MRLPWEPQRTTCWGSPASAQPADLRPGPKAQEFVREKFAKVARLARFFLSIAGLQFVVVVVIAIAIQQRILSRFMIPPTKLYHHGYYTGEHRFTHGFLLNDNDNEDGRGKVFKNASPPRYQSGSAAMYPVPDPTFLSLPARSPDSDNPSPRWA